MYFAFKNLTGGASFQVSGCRLSRDVEWTIENIFGSHQEFVQSHVIYIEEEQWALRLQPNVNGEYVVIYLLSKAPFEFYTHTDLKFSVRLKRVDETYFTLESKECLPFMNLPMLNKEEFSWIAAHAKILRTRLQKEKASLLPKGHLTLICTISKYKNIKPTKEVSTQVEDDSCFLTTLSQNLMDLYKAGKNCDVTIRVKDETFAAHRIILSARSPVLAAMFTHSLEEAENGVVSVEDCDPEGFAVFLQFVYSGSAEDLTAENAASVYYVADKYDLPELKEVCVRFMLSNLTIDNLYKAFTASESKFQEATSQFFQKITTSPQWENFRQENKAKLLSRYAKAMLGRLSDFHL